MNEYSLYKYQAGKLAQKQANEQYKKSIKKHSGISISKIKKSSTKSSEGKMSYKSGNPLKKYLKSSNKTIVYIGR